MSFNVRIYGILAEPKRGILVSDEIIQEKLYTKFPGGGLEYGEGTRDGLKREFMEELGLRVEVGKHLYTTDFFQESAFKAHDQLIAVYYSVTALDTIDISTVHVDNEPEAFEKKPHADQESFRFVKMKDFSPGMFSFPIDRVVANLIMEQFQK